MVRSKPIRRFIVSVVTALLLACQIAGVAHARLDSVQAAPAQGSCHEPTQQDGNAGGNKDCEVNCQSQLNSTAQFANVYAVTDLPMITVRTDRTAAVANSAPSTEPPLLRIESPPLLVLHSRLRN